MINIINITKMKSPVGDFIKNNNYFFIFYRLPRLLFEDRELLLDLVPADDLLCDERLGLL
jgi:hypothetical protein